MAIALTSAGHVLSSDQWLDLHTSTCAAEYEEFVREAGFEPGSSVLDAGCGNGGFIDWLQDAVGATGQVTCIDITPENCGITARKPAVDGRVSLATLGALPFADGAFDGVWCANATQYLSDEALSGALAELRRVVRPGGRVAIKDVDMTAFRVSPASPFLFSHLAEACIRSPAALPQSTGSLRGRDLKRLMEHAGFEHVTQHARFIERWAPLTARETAFWSGWLSYLANLALQQADLAFEYEQWRAIARDEGLPFVSQADFYGCEAQVLAIGTVPERR